ncbi:MAG: DUF1822 family protein [Cyanobacteria bacterium J06642_2]
MTAELPQVAIAAPTDLLLDVSADERQRFWQLSGAHSSPTTRWQAYLNHLSLHAVLEWLRDEDDRARPWPRASAATSIWEVVNGAAVQLSDGTRMTIVADEATDSSEMRVPQEWVEIPSWSASYYLAVQVEPEDGWVRLWGYATRQQVIACGRFDAGDRAYCISADDLVTDISLLHVARAFCPTESAPPEVVPLPPLPLAQAESLLQRLGNSELLTPRLAVSFSLWGALMEHGGWRQRLYRRRTGQPDVRSVVTWLQQGLTEVAGQLGWERLQVAELGAGARGEITQTDTVLSKSVMVGDREYELRLFPRRELEAGQWRFELRALTNRVEPGTTLRLLSEDLQPFAGNAVTASAEAEALYVDVAIASGEGIVWEIDPMPEDYEREILRF